MGAVVAAAVAARQRRIQEIVDAFRLTDATGSGRSCTLESLGLSDSAEVHSLIVNGVLMPGTTEGTYYLSEVGYLAQRNHNRIGLKAVLIAFLIILLAGVVLIPLSRAAKHSASSPPPSVPR
jgi:hypothetical protein